MIPSHLRQSFAIALALITLASPAFCAADLLPRADQLRADRPRILLRPTDTPLAISLRQLREMPRGKEFDELLGELRRSESAHCQALVWLLTGDKTAADKAVARMREYRFSGRVDSFHVWFRLTEFGCAYDWLHGYEAFDAAARKEVRANVTPLAEFGLKVAQDHVFHNYVWMSAGGIATWALATAGEDAACDAVYTRIRDRFERELWPTLEYLDGLPSEPMGYWAHYVFKSALMTVLAGQSASETDLVAAIREKHGNWLARNVNTLAYGTLPDLRFLPIGDLQGGPNGGVTQEMAGVIDAATWALSANAKDAPRADAELAAVRALSRRIAEVRRTGRYKLDTIALYMLYSRVLPVNGAGPAARQQARPPGAPRQDAPLSPPAFVAGGARGGHWIARHGGWGADATVVAFRCADHTGSHNHWDQGSFLIHRRGLLAVDPPVYRKTEGPQQRTEFHNTLLIGGKGQRPVRGQTFDTLAKFRQNLDAGKRLETGNLFTSPDAPYAAAGEFAQAYDCVELASCVRQVAFIEPGTLIVVDRLLAKPGKQVPDVQWLLHFPAAPVQADGAWVATNGAGWIRCRSVLGDTSAAAAVAATEMNTHRLSLSYKGGSEVVLAHVLDVGDGKAPAGTSAAVTARRANEEVVVTVGETVVRFSLASPYGVLTNRN